MWIFYMILSILCISMTTIISKLAMEHAHYHVFNALRTIFIVVTAWIIVFFVGSGQSISMLSAETWWYLIISGVTTALAWTFFYKALQMTEVRKVIPIDSSNVVIAVIFGVLLLGDIPTITTIISMITISFGIIMMIQRGSKESKKKKESRKWIIWAFLGAVFTALTNVFGSMWACQVEVNLGAAIRVLIILIIMLGILFFSKNYPKVKDVDRKGWIFIGITGILTVLSWFLFNLSLIGSLEVGMSNVVSISGELSIVTTLFLSFLILKEKISKRAIVGVVQYIIGILVMIF